MAYCSVEAINVMLSKKFPFMKFNKGYANKLKDAYVSWRVTYSHGMSYWDLIYQPGKVFGILIAIDYFTEINKYYLYPLVFVWFFGFYIIGYIDRYYIKIWQKQSEWGSRNINPFEIEMLKRVKNIERKVNAKKR